MIKYFFAIPHDWDKSIGKFGGPLTVVALHENCISRQWQIVFLNAPRSSLKRDKQNSSEPVVFNEMVPILIGEQKHKHILI